MYKNICLFLLSLMQLHESASKAMRCLNSMNLRPTVCVHKTHTLAYGAVLAHVCESHMRAP